MLTRRTALQLLAAASANAQTLAPGSPNSPERRALVDAFLRKAEGIDKRFEARVGKLPYRLFRPTRAKAPLVVYLHGSGGSGDDNLKQLALGNVFGTRVWALPENQQRFPCYVCAPQTDRGWARYEAPEGGGVARLIPGFGEGAQLALDIVDALCREFPIDRDRLYVTGQSMGGAGVWNLLANRPQMFAAAVPCCASKSLDPVAKVAKLPLWNFHGDADQTVPVATSRDRIAELRKAGGHPLSTEYTGVGHNSWEWAYSEPNLAEWVFAQRRTA